MNLEHELIRHIHAGHSIALADENVNVNLVYSTQAKSILSFALDYLGRSGEPPMGSVIEEEFDLDDALIEEPETSVDYLADKLRERYLLNNQDAIVEELATIDPEEFLPKLSQYVQVLSANTTTNDFRISTGDYERIIDEHLQSIMDGYHIGHSFGFVDIDRHTGGGRPGDLIHLVAAPKRNKTWFLIKAFLERIKKGNRPVFATLELTAKQIMGRILCLISGVSYNDYWHGRLMPKDLKKLKAANAQFKEEYGEALIIESPFEERYIDNIVLEVQRAEADSVIIDQLSFLKWRGNHYKENEGYKEVIYDMKNSANRLMIPWYVAAQLNREADESEDMPAAQKIGLTRAVEEASDLIMMLRRNHEMALEGMVQIGVVEARNCESGPNARWLVRAEFRDETSFEICE